LWCSQEMRNIDNTYRYKVIKFLFIDFSYKVGITVARHTALTARTPSSVSLDSTRCAPEPVTRGPGATVDLPAAAGALMAYHLTEILVGAG
jgi:hypothetical protein